jgi:hypothetical protein
MAIGDDLKQMVRAFVERRCSLDELRRWLRGHVQDIADSGDASAQALDGLAWLLLSECSYGHRSEDDLRRALAADLDHAGAVADADRAALSVAPAGN